MLPAKRLNGQNWLPDIFNDFFEGNSLSRINGSAPAMNVFEDEKSYSLEIAAPGMCKDDFKVHLNKDGNLVIEMEKTDCCCKDKDKEKEKKECRFLRKEFCYTKFNQTLLLPENADKENIEAHVDKGILSITIPKLEKPKIEDGKREIEVK